MTRTRPTPDDVLAYGIVYSVDPRVCTNLTTATWSGANRAIFTRTLAGGTISKIRIEVGVSSGNISLAAYANDGTGTTATPLGAPLATTGAIACPSTGVQDVSLGSTITLAAGDWLCMTCDNTTATFSRVGLINTNFLGGFMWRADSSHPAPTIGAALTLPSSYVPVMIGIP